MADVTKASLEWAASLWAGIEEGISQNITNGEHCIDDFLAEMGYDSSTEDYFDVPYEAAWDVFNAAEVEMKKAFMMKLIEGAKKFPVGPKG